MAERSTWNKARRNIEELIRDVALDGVDWEPDGKPGDGAFPVRLVRAERSVRVDMPGLALKGTIRRMYVNGSSWMWEYAVPTIREELDPKDPHEADVSIVMAALADDAEAMAAFERLLSPTVSARRARRAE